MTEQYPEPVPEPAEEPSHKGAEDEPQKSGDSESKLLSQEQ